MFCGLLQVVLTFLDFEVEYIDKCAYDSLVIYNGADLEDHNMLSHLCGEIATPFKVYGSSGSIFFIIFSSTVSKPTML